ncbi:hypothetical protein ACFXGA_30490 [Actinosynnema sp. NPDC059335]|uniref:hypothetical protein n=1 Tax=Actinosynnema sp. NPDC059335 TaxID=3346804 RepID=UPI00366B8AA1
MRQRRQGRAMFAGFAGWLATGVWHRYAVEMAQAGTLNGTPPTAEVVIVMAAIGFGVAVGAAWAVCVRRWSTGRGWRVPLVAVGLFVAETGIALLLSLVYADRSGVAALGSLPIGLVLYFAIRRPDGLRHAEPSGRRADRWRDNGLIRFSQRDGEHGTDHADVVRAAALSGARAVAPALEARLRQYYGPDWLVQVNSTRGAGQRARGLRDHRFCLSTLANDRATEGWAPAHVRRDARRLAALSNAAAHDDPCGPREAHEARQLANRLIAANLGVHR